MRYRFLIALICAGSLAGAAPLVLHVAPKGFDGNPGTQAAPFASIERARDAIRALKQKQPVTVYIHGGTYFLTAPLHFTMEDTGTTDAPITYAAWQKERPVISAGRAIGGWKEATIDGKHLWAAEIPDVREGKWYFHELWINGKRAVPARSPNQGFWRVSGVPDLDPKKQYQIGNTSFEFKPGEVAQWKNMEDAYAVFLTFWISSRRHIASIDEAKHVATLEQPTPMRLTDGFGQTPLARYYVENAFELLDAPGEWYLNRKTGTVYYMPRAGERIAKAEAIAPVLDHVMFVEGEPRQDRHVEYLTFRGLTFAHSEVWLPAQDRGSWFERQAAAPVPGAVRLVGARNCNFDHCTIAHISSYALQFSRGCDHDKLTHSELFDLGTGGVKVGEPDRIGNVAPGMQSPFPDDPKLETHDIEITDNDVREGSRVFHQGHGILVGQSYNNLIAHNDIHDFYQNGISVGWTWGYGKSLARNNVVEYNRIYQIGQGWSSDVAGVYTLGTQPGTVIRNNLIHDVECADYIGRGVYLDEGSTEIVVENNVIYRTSTGGFGMNFGKRNIIRNNVFAFGERSQIEPVGTMQKAPPGNSYVLEKNIFLLQQGGVMGWDRWRPRPADEVTFRGNLYWQEGGGEINFGTWKLDDASKVADPLFVNPAKGDFKLKPGSPAKAMGFQAIDLATVGPR